MTRLLFKQFIIIALIILAILSIYFGSLLPLIKSRAYISALNSMSSIKSLDDFKNNFDKPLNFYSPVGDEEIAKFLSSNILRIVSDTNNSEEVSRYVLNYIEPYMFKNDVRHLTITGQMYFIMWQRSSKEEDFKKAEEYYQKAFSIGPKLPPVLYNLLDLYRLKGDREKISEIGEIILNYWPDDEKTKEILDAIK